MTMDLHHWHKTAADERYELWAPAECCTQKASDMLAKELDAARRAADREVHDERKRIIVEAVKAIEAYREGAVSVLDGEKGALVEAVAKAVTVAVKRTGCICPPIEVTAFGEGTRYLRGWDSSCGMHDGEAS